ncbi:MAG: peptidyl-prolyl cis-trans isomerase [Candidatus Cloacimonadota bacterium]|nr:peptidyl-prolyl cis-trans isomerase [Candidatus Cloacimonadota bacterium]
MIRKRIITRILFVAFLTTFIFACRCSFLSKIGKKVDTSPVLAEWEGGKITENDLEKRLESIPEFYRPKQGFSVEQKQKFLKDYTIEEIFYLEAKGKGFDKNENVKDDYNKNSTPIILNQYTQEEIQDKVKSTESNLMKFYNENKDKFFTQEPTATILHIQTSTLDSAKQALSKLAEGIDFTKVVNEYSTNNYSKEKGGKITKIRKGAYIPTIGKSPELDSLIFSAELDKICEPIKFKDNYHIIKVIDRDTTKYKPFEVAKKDVERRYKLKEENEIREKLIAKLIKKYDITLDSTAIKNIDFQKADTLESEANIQLIKSPFAETSFTVGDFAKDLLQMAEPRKQSLENYKARKMYLTGKLKNNAMYYDAIKKGYEKNPKIEPELSRLKMVMALREYYKSHIVDSTIVPEEEIREVYEKEKDVKYKIRPSCRIQQFVFNEKETADYVLFKAKKAESDEELNELIKEYATYKTKNGILGPVYETGSIPGLGKDPLYVTKIFETKVGEFSDVFQNRKSEYVFFKVLSYKPVTYKSFDSVSKEIKTSLFRKKQRERFENVKDILTKKYNLKIYPEKFEKKLPVDSLYKLAEEAMSHKGYNDAIYQYDQIIKYYKNGKDDYKATFMKGFIYSENLNNKKKAQRMFEKVLSYPKGELHESAEYMLKELKGEDDILEKINKAPE